MVDFHNFVRWCENHFSPIVIKGEEVRINSIFTEDNKQHLWCNPSGGKRKIEDGCYQCFKTGNHGTLLGLIMKVDCCNYWQAKEILETNSQILSNLEEKLDAFFEEIKNSPESKLELPEGIEKLPEEAVSYLKRRKICEDGFLYCTKYPYQGRILIPYYDKMGKLIYYNCRAIKKDAIRYLGPPKTCGIGKSDVIFMPFWSEKGNKVYLTEGEFDALSLRACGFYSAACGGKNLSDKQVLLLNGYDICLSVDRDKAGFAALVEIGNKLVKKGFKASFIRPACGYKDWNEMLVKLNEKNIIEYIDKNEKVYDSWTGDSLLFGEL